MYSVVVPYAVGVQGGSVLSGLRKRSRCGGEVGSIR